jgi:uncharacterized protein YbjT (DUF2867 family)
MAADARRVLVVGASGNTGAAVIRQLLDRGAKARALVRDRGGEVARAPVLADPGVDLVAGDLARPETLAKAVEGCDGMFVTTPHAPEMCELQGNAIDAATAVGAHVVRVSGWTPSVAADSPAPGGRRHWATEQHLKESGLPYTILQCNYFAQNLVNRNASSIVGNDMLAGPLADARISMVDAADIAAVAACALTEQGHENTTYTLSGPAAVSYQEIVDTLSSLLGRTIRYVDVPPDDFRRWMLENGRLEWEADHALALFEMYRAGLGETVTDAVERVTGQPPQSVESYLRRNLDAFRKAA